MQNITPFVSNYSFRCFFKNSCLKLFVILEVQVKLTLDKFFCKDCKVLDYVVVSLLLGVNLVFVDMLIIAYSLMEIHINCINIQWRKIIA